MKILKRRRLLAAGEKQIKEGCVEEVGFNISQDVRVRTGRHGSWKPRELAASQGGRTVEVTDGKCRQLS